MKRYTVLALPNDKGFDRLDFEDGDALHSWFMDEYICGACKKELEEEYGPEPWALMDILMSFSGCMCEIQVIDRFHEHF